MANLKTNYMGLELENPIVVGASGLTANIEVMKKIENAGAGAVVCKSLFEEQVQLEELKFKNELHKNDNWHHEMHSIFPDLEDGGIKSHLFWVKKTKESMNIPVIASLNAVNESSWVEYSKRLEDTGIDGIELNLYATPGAGDQGSNSIEDRQYEILKKVKSGVSIPVGVKLSPYYTNAYSFIKGLSDLKIDGVVLFNRFFSSDINIENENNFYPFTFSSSQDNRLTLRYMGLLAGNVSSSLIASTGIMNSEDLIKMILVGADGVQVVSALYNQGIKHISTMKEGLESWMEEKGYANLDAFRGKLSRKAGGDEDAWLYKRAQYVKILMKSTKELLGDITG